MMVFRMTTQEAINHKKRSTPIFAHNSKVFRRALALGGHIETDDEGRPIVIVPEHAIDVFKKWMAKCSR